MKRIALAVAVAFLFACGPKDEPSTDSAGIKDGNVRVAVSPSAAVLAPLAVQMFTATVTGSSDRTVSWSADGGTVDSSGLYTAPALAGTYHVTATANADTTMRGTATISVSPPPVVIAVTPADPIVNGCGTVQFSATVSGGTGANAGVTWSLADEPLPDGHSLGTISPTGLYTSPDPRPYNQMVTHIRATSVEDPNVSVVVPVTTNFNVTQVSVTPVTVTTVAGATTQFVATVTTSCGP